MQFSLAAAASYAVGIPMQPFAFTTPQQQMQSVVPVLMLPLVFAKFPMQPLDLDRGPQQLLPFVPAIPLPRLQQLPFAYATSFTFAVSPPQQQPFVFAASGAEGRAETSTAGETPLALRY